MSQIIDTHTHIFSESVCKDREKFFHDSSFMFLYEGNTSKIMSADLLFDSMNQHGVAKSFCLSFPWYDVKDCDRENQYILESARSSSGKLVPFGAVPRSGKIVIRDYIHTLAQSGFAGIGEIGFYDTGFGQNEQIYLCDVLQGAADEKLIVVIHLNEPVGHEYKGKYKTDLSILIDIISGFQGVTIILAHWGGGLFLYELMPEIKEKLAGVFYDTAASPYLYDQRIFKAAIVCVGSEKILFGSDYPLLTPKRYLEQIAFLKKEDQLNILQQNATRLLMSKLGEFK